MKSTSLRLIAAFMALVMMACCFTACSDNTTEESTTTTTTEQNPFDNFSGNDNSMWDDTTITMSNQTNPQNTTTNANNNNTTTTTVVNNNTTTTTTKPATTTTTTTTTKPATTTTTTNPFDSVTTTAPAVSKDDMTAVLEAAGYAYDAKQQVYYSTLNPWQRHFGFGDIYDVAAAYTNMIYTTFKADFEYDGLLWRLQWWKGQYGILEGAEMGVYTKDPNSENDFYDCADDEHLLEMSFEYYRTAEDFRNNTRLFIREEQAHWWLTGFKIGYISNFNTNASVVKATLKAYDKDMADGIESGLRRLTNQNGKKVSGFIEYGPNTPEKLYDYYIRNGNTFTVVWQTKGYKNHQSGAISPDA